MKVTSLAFVALAPLLASCASWGLYNMSDDWCAKHVDASEARCPREHGPARVVHNDSERAADEESPKSD